MGRAWIVAAVVLTGVAACSDDGDDAEVVTQEVYDGEAERLCDQHGDVLQRAYVEEVPDSDAEEAAFYTSEVIPRARAIIRRLAELGFPPDKDAEYRESLNGALAALDELEAQPYRYIDQRHRRELTPEEDLINRLQSGLAGADIPC